MQTQGNPDLGSMDTSDTVTNTDTDTGHGICEKTQT